MPWVRSVGTTSVRGTQPNPSSVTGSPSGQGAAARMRRDREPARYVQAILRVKFKKPIDFAPNPIGASVSKRPHCCWRRDHDQLPSGKQCRFNLIVPEIGAGSFKQHVEKDSDWLGRTPIDHRHASCYVGRQAVASEPEIETPREIGGIKSAVGQKGVVAAQACRRNLRSSRDVPSCGYVLSCHKPVRISWSKSVAPDGEPLSLIAGRSPWVTNAVIKIRCRTAHRCSVLSPWRRAILRG
jgi:hypothetical protein